MFAQVSVDNFIPAVFYKAVAELVHRIYADKSKPQTAGVPKMKQCAYSSERERIIADAICPVASELRLIDVADLVSMLRFERNGDLSDLVASAAELVLPSWNHHAGDWRRLLSRLERAAARCSRSGNPAERLDDICTD
jgi:hypothetical protein